MQKRVPIRMCVGCRESSPKKDLLRIVRSSDGEISLDLSGKKSGRGAYICRNTDCLAKARKSRSLERAFGAPIDDLVYGRLAAEIANCGEEEDGQA